MAAVIVENKERQRIHPLRGSKQRRFRCTARLPQLVVGRGRSRARAEQTREFGFGQRRIRNGPRDGSWPLAANDMAGLAPSACQASAVSDDINLVVTTTGRGALVDSPVWFDFQTPAVSTVNELGVNSTIA